MATFTYGFYNAINGDRAYDSIQMSEIFDGVIADGVYATVGDCFMVNENLDTDNTITIGSGRAWFNHTWNKLDVKMIFSCPAAESNTNRIDAIVIEVDEPNRTNSIKVIMGTPNTNPVKPTLQNSNGVHQHPIAYIRRNMGVKKIEQQHIENAVGTTDCKWVTGVINTLDATNLYNQWSSAWNTWFNSVKSNWTIVTTQYDDEWNQIKTRYENDWTGIKEEYALQWEELKNSLTNEQQEIVEDLQIWVQNQQIYVENWFENDIKGKLGEDPATSLQMQFNELEEGFQEAESYIYDTMNNNTSFASNGDITEKYADGRKIVTHTVNENKMTQTYYQNDQVIGVKTIDFNSDGSISQTYEPK